MQLSILLQFYSNHLKDRMKSLGYPLSILLQFYSNLVFLLHLPAFLFFQYYSSSIQTQYKQRNTLYLFRFQYYSSSIQTLQQMLVKPCSNCLSILLQFYSNMLNSHISRATIFFQYYSSSIQTSFIPAEQGNCGLLSILLQFYSNVKSMSLMYISVSAFNTTLVLFKR